MRIRGNGRSGRGPPWAGHGVQMVHLNRDKRGHVYVGVELHLDK